MITPLTLLFALLQDLSPSADEHVEATVPAVHDDHVGHDHAGHDHAGHDHAGHDHAEFGAFQLGDAQFDAAVVVDVLADRLDDDAGPDGFDLDLRVFELDLEARAGDWLGYAVVVGDGEELQLEEAAAVYSGLGDATIRGGRFFADFGAQMRLHVHELPYPERPGVLRAYLGDELPGTGAQFDTRFGRGARSSWRASFGVFSELGADHAHGDEEEEGPEQVLAERRDLGDLAFTARVAQRLRSGEHGRFEWGLSARHLADLGFEDDDTGLAVEDLSNTVFGVDARFTDRPGEDEHASGAGWTFGGELLLATGDLGAEVDEGAPAPGDESLRIFDDEVSGWYAFGERHFDERTSLGLMLGSFEHPEDGAPEEFEAVGYLTRRVGHGARLRFFAGTTDSDESGEAFRVGVRLTAVFGPHSHARWGGFER